jgi:hypothetical protein
MNTNREENKFNIGAFFSDFMVYIHRKNSLLEHMYMKLAEWCQALLEKSPVSQSLEKSPVSQPLEKSPVSQPLEKSPVSQPLEKFPHFMEPEGSLQHLQELSLVPILNQANLAHTTPFKVSKIHLSIIRPPTSSSS